MPTEKLQLSAGFQKSQKLTATPAPHMIFGMYNATAPFESGLNDGQANGCEPPANGYNAAQFRATVDTYQNPNVLVRRSFSGGPVNWTSGNNSALQDAYVALNTHGIWMCHSFQGNDANNAAMTVGSALWNQWVAVGASLPDGAYATYHHEPENDYQTGGDGSQFAAAFAKVYDAMKTGNPNIYMGPAYLIYHWRTANTGPFWVPAAMRDTWYPGDAHCDWLGCDVYSFEWETLVSLRTKNDMQNWYNWAAGKPKPLFVTEYGIENITSTTTAARATERKDHNIAPFLADSLQWLSSAPTGWAQRPTGFAMVLYWNTVNAPDRCPSVSHSINATARYHDEWVAGGPLPNLSAPNNWDDAEYFRTESLAAWNDACLQWGGPSHDIADLT